MAQERVCSSCGGALKDDSVFCPSCGKSVEVSNEVDCPSCGEKNEPKSKYCYKCGIAISLTAKPRVNRPEPPEIRQTAPEPPPRPSSSWNWLHYVGFGLLGYIGVGVLVFMMYLMFPIPYFWGANGISAIIGAVVAVILVRQYKNSNATFNPVRVIGIGFVVLVALIVIFALMANATTRGVGSSMTESSKKDNSSDSLKVSKCGSAFCSAGKTMEIHAKTPQVVDRAFFVDKGGKTRIVVAGDSNSQLVVVEVTVVNRSSTVLPFLIDADGVQIGDRRGKRYGAINPFEKSKLYNGTLKESREVKDIVPVLWGETNLRRHFQVGGHIVFDIPKGTILGTLFWDDIEYIPVDFIDYWKGP